MQGEECEGMDGRDGVRGEEWEGVRAGVGRGDTAVTVQCRPTWCMRAFRLSPPPPLVLPCSGDPESLLPLCWSKGTSDTTNTHAKY